MNMSLTVKQLFTCVLQIPTPLPFATQKYTVIPLRNYIYLHVAENCSPRGSVLGDLYTAVALHCTMMTE